MAFLILPGLGHGLTSTLELAAHAVLAPFSQDRVKLLEGATLSRGTRKLRRA